MKTLIFATATSGLPLWQSPSEDPDQPFVVELCARLFEDGILINTLDLLIDPSTVDMAFTMPAEVVTIHGLTADYLLREGASVPAALGEFEVLLGQANQIALFASAFQIRMMRIMFAKIGVGDWEPGVPVVNIQALAAPYTRVPKARPQTPDDWKHPTLEQAIGHFVGEVPPRNGRAGDAVDAHVTIARHVKVSGVVA